MNESDNHVIDDNNNFMKCLINWIKSTQIMKILPVITQIVEKINTLSREVKY